MARWWKEPYTDDKAKQLDIRDGPESYLILGGANAQWIYYVYVCSFTFAFFSLAEIEEYIAHYSKKILPSSRASSIWIGEPQSKFDRLPLRLREEGKRQKVVKALTRALTEFRKHDSAEPLIAGDANAAGSLLRTKAATSRP